MVITVSKVSFVQSVAAEQTSKTGWALSRGGGRRHGLCGAFEAVLDVQAIG